MKPGEKIRYFRKTQNMSQQDLAEGICSISYLSKIENGQAEASNEIVLFLLNRLGKDLGDEQFQGDMAQKLQDWFYFMFAKKHEKAKQHYKELSNEATIDVELQIYYKSMETMFHLVSNIQPEIVKQNIDDLTSIQEVIKNKNLLYFHLVKGVYNYTNKNYNDSYTYLKKVENKMFEIQVSQWEKGYIYYLLGLVSSRLWKNMISLDYTRTALKTFEELYEFNRCADCRILLGIIYQRIESYSEAIKHLELAESVADAFNDNHLLGIVYQNLGYIESKKDNSVAAIELYQKSLFYKKEQAPVQQVATIFTLIEEYYKQGNSYDGLKMVEKGLELVDNDDSLLEYKYHYRFYYYVFHLGLDHEKTIEYLTDVVIPYFESKKKWVHLSELARIVGSYYEKKAKYKAANEYFHLTIMALQKISQTEDL
ncbi:helix-turn-helix transcriptional regulator [Fictibacillus barbaricus]|uniref:Transcriptional regulator with XRE-family HTH domain n=1 Tax=Fictibacillus barbaricus TaxID=182136 RepID=A0ABU1U3F2_9BACL|nr:helix-turn-helix transcriptional regulator [Fictibacillus barbaricus]MDR7073994.1 transcriptional regulator with XRE-family HTH domain [Fictibacillus barbaricus]